MLFRAGMERRTGKVKVYADSKEWMKILAAVQKDCLVLYSEYRPVDDAFHMDLYHESFAPVEPHTKSPHYEAVLQTTDEGIVRTGWTRL